MALLQGVDCRQTKLSRKTIEGNSGSERSRLIGEEDLERIKKETRSE